MAGEYDEKFDELTGLVQTVVGRVGELRLEVRDIHASVRESNSKIDEQAGSLAGITDKVNVLSRQFSDVGVMTIKDNKRVDDLERRVSDLESGVH